MTIIKLENNYFIEIDPLNYTLKQKFIGKTKNGEEKESIKVVGYYGDLKDAIMGYLHYDRINLLDRQVFEMIDYVKTIEQLDKSTVAAICEVVKGEE